MRKILITLSLVLILTGIGHTANISSFDGITVGTSAGNINAWDDKTLGTASGNVNAWNSLSVSIGGAGTYTDNFTGTNNTSIDTNKWEVFYNATHGLPKIYQNQAASFYDSGYSHYAIWKTANHTFTDNQYVKADCNHISVRASATANQEIRMYGSAGAGQYACEQDTSDPSFWCCTITLYVSGQGTVTTRSTGWITDGAVLYEVPYKLSVSGTTVNMFVTMSGNKVLTELTPSYTLSGTYPTGGQPGFLVNTGSATCDNFEAGELP